MAAVRTGAILVFLSVFPGSEHVSGQRVPCYQCEEYNGNRLQTSPHQQMRTHCAYPCRCEDGEPTCPPDASVIRDGCGCCPICAGQLGEPCDGTSVCDDRKGLVCRYPYSGASVGMCQATTGLPCTVLNKTYSHGETFRTDCRTQCSCQNGTYACSSLCPNENISPRGACTHPRLVEVPDQCCREWMCDSTEAEQPPVCKEQFTSWSPCSAECGLGVSRRVSNLNQKCELRNETRMCQLRPCEAGMLSLEQRARHRHIRRGHECKATQRVRGPVRLRFGPCRSKKRYRPKFCGSCDDKLGDGCCTPQLSTTIKVEFICSSVGFRRDPEDVLLELIEPGRDLWWPDDLLAIGKQRVPAVRTEKKAEQRMEAPDNALPKDRKVPFRDAKAFDPKDEDVNSLRSNEAGRPLVGGHVAAYEPAYEGESGDPYLDATATPGGSTEGKSTATASSTVSYSTSQGTTSESTTTKPKKKRKKKPRKAFTSWLEFRDEEYQMDEYEDEDETRSNRKKRSPEGTVSRQQSDGRREAGGKRYSGSFRQGYLEELQSKDDEYEDEDDNEEEEEDDSEEDDEDSNEEDDDDDDDEDEDYDGKPPSKRNRQQSKPIFYAFYRRRRDTVPSPILKISTHSEKNVPGKRSPRPPKIPDEMRRKGGKFPRGFAHGKRKNSTTDEINRMARIERRRKTEKRKQDFHKKKPKDQKEGATPGADAEKGLENRIPEPRRGSSPGDGDLLKTGRIATEKGSGGRQQSPRDKALFHVAGKARKRSRRHAPRPPWSEEDEDEYDNLDGGDHTVSFSVQWIVKCHCDRDCDVDTTTTTAPSEGTDFGEVILKRVHRTAPP